MNNNNLFVIVQDCTVLMPPLERPSRNVNNFPMIGSWRARVDRYNASRKPKDIIPKPTYIDPPSIPIRSHKQARDPSTLAPITRPYYRQLPNFNIDTTNHVSLPTMSSVSLPQRN